MVRVSGDCVPILFRQGVYTTFCGGCVWGASRCDCRVCGEANTYYDRNIVNEPFYLKVISVDGRVLKEAVFIQYFFEADKKDEKKLERVDVVQEFEAYETLYQPIFATPWLGELEQGSGFYLKHLLHIRAVNKKADKLSEVL